MNIFSQYFKKITDFANLAILLSLICSPNAYSMEDEDQKQTFQIQQDAEILRTILDEHKGDAFAYDPRYSQLGDRLIDFASNVKTPYQEENFATVRQDYETDKKNNKLNSFRLTWLGIQLSMALTTIPKDQKKITIGVTHHIETLNKKSQGTPMWLRSFATLEEEEQKNFVNLFSELKICHLYSQPMAVYTGNSHFSMKDSLAMAQHGIFLYCLNPSTGKGHTVHGGTIRNTNEKTQHDILHYMEQWISDKERDYTNFHDFLNRCDFQGCEIMPLSPPKKRTIYDVRHDKGVNKYTIMASDGTKLEGILNIKMSNNYFLKTGRLMPRAVNSCKNNILEDVSKNGHTDKSLMMQEIDEARNTWNKLAGAIYRILDNPDLLNSTEKAQLEIVAFEMLHEGTFRVPLLLQSLPKDPPLLDVVKKVAETSKMETIETLDLPDDEEQFYAKRAEEKQFDNVNPGQKGWKDRKVLKVIHIDENKYPDLYKVGVDFRFGTHTTNDIFFGDMYFDTLGHYRHWKAFHRDLAHSLIEKGLWDPENKVLGTKYDIATVKDILLDCYAWFLNSLEEGGKLHGEF